jgi:hypothetical protein
VRPDLEAQVQEFKRKHFRPVTIGLQIRRLKCDGWEGSIHCEQLPVVENFAAVAQMLQVTGIAFSAFVESKCNSCCS